MFDLDTRQYDAVNAFTNSHLDETVYIELPPGYEIPGWIGLLKRALYGLRRSPLLWHQELSNTLISLGLTQGSEETCIFHNDWLIVFFFVDDIVAAYRPADKAKMDQFEQQLFTKYEIRPLGELKWFLGIQVLRDRPSRKLWLSQHSYFDKLATTYHLPGGRIATPTTAGLSLAKYSGQATPAQVQGYQRKVGSLTYPSVITRADVAYPVSKLAEHLLNPGPQHQQGADRILGYLYHTRYMALEFDGLAGPDLLAAADASYADNDSRKSTQAYIVMLFGGLVAWKSNKQSIVTGSTTEAELLSLTSATKEVMQIFRIFRDIQLDVESGLTVYCDNQQAIRIVTAEGQRIKTALKHIDVPQLWMRQEYQRGSVDIQYMPTADMPADGLTKALTAQQLGRFYRQINLVNIEPLLELMKDH